MRCEVQEKEETTLRNKDSSKVSWRPDRMKYPVILEKLLIKLVEIWYGTEFWTC